MRKEEVESLKGKLVFFDFDGTLSEYRFLNKVGPEELTGEFLYKLAFERIYDTIRPLSTMQEVVKMLDPEKVYILGAITLNTEIEEKQEWLRKYYPSIKKENMIFVNNSETKLEMLEAYRQKLNLDYKDIAFIDDKHSTIQSAEKMGFIAYHPSTFVD